MSIKGEAMTLLTVKKMDRAVKFYTDKLDAKVLERAKGEMKDWWAALEIGGATFWLVRPEAPEKRTLAYQGLTVKNIHKTVAKLLKNGVKFDEAETMGPDTKVDGPIATSAAGSSAFFKDTEGNLWMLYQG